MSTIYAKFVRIPPIAHNLHIDLGKSIFSAPDKGVKRFLRIAFIIPESLAQYPFIDFHVGSLEKHLSEAPLHRGELDAGKRWRCRDGNQFSFDNLGFPFFSKQTFRPLKEKTE